MICFNVHFIYEFCKNHTITIPRYENNLLFHRFWSVDDEQVAFTITITIISIIFIIIIRIVILIIIVIITRSIVIITLSMVIITTSIVIIMIVNLIQMHTEYSALRSVVVANYEETVRYLPRHHHLYLDLDDNYPRHHD